MNVTNATSVLVNATSDAVSYAMSTVLIEKGMLAVLLIVQVASVLSLLAMVTLLATQLARLEHLLRTATGAEQRNGLLDKPTSRWCVKKRRSSKTDPEDTAVSATRDPDEVSAHASCHPAPRATPPIFVGRTLRRGRGGRSERASPARK